MSSTRLVSAIAFSVLFTGTVLAVVFDVSTRNSSGSNMLGPNRDWAWLGLVLGAIQGLIVGGISAALITGLELSVVKAILVGLFLNLLLEAVSLVLTGDGWNLEFLLPFAASLVVGMINGALVSFFFVDRTSIDHT